MKQFFCVSFMFISLLSCNNQINNESFNNELVLIPQHQFSVNKYEITVTEFAQFVEKKIIPQQQTVLSGVAFFQPKKMGGKLLSLPIGKNPMVKLKLGKNNR